MEKFMTTHVKSVDGNSGDWKEELDGHLGEVKDNLATASDAVIGFIKEKPVVSLLGALAVGYVFGRIVRR
jgi:hypothetical protein